VGWPTMTKVKPLPPVQVKFNIWNACKLWFMVLISFILWVVLFVAGITILSYYGYSIVAKGFFDPEVLKYSLLLVVAAYFGLILDKKKISDALNIKRDLPFITIEQREKKGKDG
jgi:hypothetical protein